jgi:hypothetical protein
MAVHSAVLKGWKEMPEMTHADTLGMAHTFDIIRAQAAAKAPVAATLEQVPPSRYRGHESATQTELGSRYYSHMRTATSNQCQADQCSVCDAVQGVLNDEQDKLGGNPVAPGAARKDLSASLNGFAGTVHAATFVEPATAA